MCNCITITTAGVNWILILFCVYLQVLATVKNQIEELAATRKDFPELITAAQHWLLAREALFGAAGDNTPTFRIFVCVPAMVIHTYCIPYS